MCHDGVIRAGVAALAALLAGAGSTAPPMAGDYAPVNGLQLYYEVHGPKESTATPLLLLHGGGSTIETSFGELIGPLSRSRRVIAFEQQGHWRTADVADRPFSFERSAVDAIALLKHLKIERADWLGYSNGGHSALQVATTHPEVVRKLVVVSAMYSREWSDSSFWESFEHAKLEEIPVELADAYRKVAPHPEQLPTFFAKSVQRMVEFKGWGAEEIRSIEAPTLVTAGDVDIVRPEHAVAMVRLLPHAELAILPGTDHMAIVRRAAWLAPMVEAFLDAPMPGAK